MVGDSSFARHECGERIPLSGCAVFKVDRERTGEVVRDRTERIGTSPSEEGSPADLVVLDRVAKGEGGLIVEGGEFGTELAVESEQRTGFDRAKCFGECIVTIWVRAGTEVSFHRAEVEFLAAGLEVQLFCMGAVADEQVCDIVALSCPSKVKRIGELGLRPAAGAKEFLDHAVEAGVNGFMEQTEIFAGAFSHASALPGFERILKREELASLDSVQELFNVLRQGSVANGHVPRMLRAAAWAWQGSIVRRSIEDRSGGQIDANSPRKLQISGLIFQKFKINEKWR
jgi:hypothetical protein